MTAKLLIVCDDYVAGGAFVVGERLARGLTGAFRVTFACDVSPTNAAARRRLAQAGVRVVALFAHADEARSSYDRFSACGLLRRVDPDKILFVDSSPRSNLALKDVARGIGKPYVCMINFVDRETPAALRRFDADVVRTADGSASLVFVSSAARAEFQANYPAVVTPSLVVANGVSDEFFATLDRQAREAVRRELGVGERDILALLLGRLEPRKGQGLALRALKALSDEPTVRLALAGYGDAAATLALQGEIRALRLEDRVTYLGPRSDVPRLLDACDVVLLPSAQEADPLAAKEAMAKGRPVVASDLPGLREQGHDAALLIPVAEDAPEETVDALVAVLDKLRRDVGRREDVGRNLRAVAERRFTLTQMAQAYRDILDGLPTSRRRVWSEGDDYALSLGRWLDLSKPETAAVIFKSGWAEFESGGVWSLGSQSCLAFVLPSAATEVEIAFKVSALATPGHARAFDILTNRRRAATWRFADGEGETRVLRAVSSFPKRVFVIRFRSHDLVSPVEFGLNEDRRQLGLFLSAMRIGPAEGWIRRAARAWRGAEGRS